MVSGILLGLFGCMDRNPLMKDTGFGPGLETKKVQHSKNSLFFYCLFQEPQSFSVFHDISASLSMSDPSSLQTTWLLSSDSFHSLTTLIESSATMGFTLLIASLNLPLGLNLSIFPVLFKLVEEEGDLNI